MATSIESHESEHYVDFDEYIDFQLEKTRSNVKLTDVLTAMAGVTTLFVGYLLCFVLFDHWVVPGGFSTLARGLMLGGLAAVSLAWIVWKVVLPYTRRVNGLFAAKLIENTEPGLKSSLLNLVDLDRAGKSISADVRNSLEKRAALTLSHIDVDHAIDRRQLIRLSYALLVVVVLACLYTLFSPKKISNSIWRAIVPSADVSVATRTEIVDVRPGDTDVLARTQLDVLADLRGEVPERVVMLYTTSDRKFVDEPIEMRLVDETLKRYRGSFTGENGRGLLQDMSYRVVAGDATSADYQVHVIQPPSATIESVRYEYPSYMELQPKSLRVGYIDAWEGTEVTVRATANMPVRSATLRFSDTEDTTAKAEEIRMQIEEGTRLSATWTLGFRADGTHPHFYRVECENERREVDPKPTIYSVKIRPDLPPELVLLDPVSDLEMPANATVPLAIRARDPDFKLRYINLNVEKDGQPVGASQEIFEGLQQGFSTIYDWNLKPYGLKTGDVLSYWIEARDNKLPFGNRKNTGKLRIRILDRVSKQEAEELLEEEKQRQQQRLEDQDDAIQPDEQNDAEDGGQAEQQQDQPPQDGEASEESQDGQEGDDQKAAQDDKSGEGAEPDAGNQTQPGDDSSPDGSEQDPQQGEDGQGQQGDDQKDSRQLDPNEAGDDPEVLRKLMEHQKQQENGEPLQDRPGEKHDGEKHDGEKQPGASQPDQGQDGQPSDPKAGEGGKQPSQPDQPADSARPGEADTPKNDASDPNKPQNDEGMKDGRKQPSPPSDDAQRRKADSDEKGDAQPDRDPNADPTPAKNDLQRKPDEKPQMRRRQGPADPNAADKSQRQGDDPKSSKPSASQQRDRQPNADDRPSQSKDQGDERPAANKDREQQPGNEDKQGDGRPKGQEAEQPQGGEAGNSRQSDQGNQGSRQPGAGDSDSRPGDAESSSKPGDPSENQEKGDGSQQPSTAQDGKQSPAGNGSQGDSGKPGDMQSENGDGSPAADGQQGQGQSGQPSGIGTSDGTKPAAADQGSAQGGGGQPGSAPGDGSGGSPGDVPPQAEQPHLEDMKKAANLVLKKLENDIEQGEVDPELLKELGWTEEQIKRFANRLRKQLDHSKSDMSPQAEAQRRQFEETLRTLELKSKGVRRTGRNRLKRATDDISARRIPVPSEYREAFEAYSRSLAKEADRSK